MIKKIIVLVLFCILGLMLHRFIKDNPSLSSDVDTAIFQTSSPVQRIVGGDEDEHGCIGSAGYAWCEAEKRCIKLYEESCSSD